MVDEFWRRVFKVLMHQRNRSMLAAMGKVSRKKRPYVTIRVGEHDLSLYYHFVPYIGAKQRSCFI